MRVNDFALTAAMVSGAIQPDEAAAPPPLPAGPVWERLVLEEPLMLTAALLGGALLGFFLLNRRGKAGKGFAVAGGLGLLTALLWLVAGRVSTEREQVAEAGAALVDAAARADVAALAGMLDESAVAYAREFPAGISKDRILAEVRRTLGERFQVKEQEVLASQAAIDGPGVARAQLKVRVVESGTGLPFTSWWRLDLRRDGAGRWLTTGIRPLHPWIAAPESR